MCPVIPALATGLLILLSPQNQLNEGRAVSYVQQLQVQQLDRNLPPSTFGNWIRQITGADTGLTWMMTDCGVQPAGRREVPACVEVNGILPNLRKFAVVVRIGTTSGGIDGRPAVQFSIIEEKGKLFDAPSLRDLGEMLRMRVIKPRRRPVVLPRLPERRVPLPLPVWSKIDAQQPGESPGINPPHLAMPSPVPTRVSEGALIGSALVRVVPDYPLLARQNRITGQVTVQVTIAEDGRVVEAAAVSGPPVLRTAAEVAARKWIFRPTILNGNPVRLQGNLTFVFTQP